MDPLTFNDIDPTLLDLGPIDPTLLVLEPLEPWDWDLTLFIETDTY